MSAERQLERAWTVKRLIEELQNLDPEAKVFFAHPSHTYWKYDLATGVTGLDEEDVQYSGYAGQYRVPHPDKGIDRTEGNVATVVLLK